RGHGFESGRYGSSFKSVERVAVLRDAAFPHPPDKLFRRLVPPDPQCFAPDHGDTERRKFTEPIGGCCQGCFAGLRNLLDVTKAWALTQERLDDGPRHQDL